ncbi:hypothetical protein [Microbacterium sp. WHRI 7836]|uniref:hypothetical protein n=1 Tax=Microbacterium TaxID=33882 RepID=UPI0032EE65A2
MTIHDSTLSRVSDPGDRSRIAPDLSDDPILGFPAAAGAVLGAYGAITILLDAYERGQQAAG